MTKKLDFFGKKRAYNRDENRHIVDWYCQECPFENQCERDNVVCASAYKELTYGN